MGRIWTDYASETNLDTFGLKNSDLSDLGKQPVLVSVTAHALGKFATQKYSTAK